MPSAAFRSLRERDLRNFYLTYVTLVALVAFGCLPKPFGGFASLRKAFGALRLPSEGLRVASPPFRRPSGASVSFRGPSGGFASLPKAFGWLRLPSEALRRLRLPSEGLRGASPPFRRPSGGFASLPKAFGREPKGLEIDLRNFYVTFT